MEPLDIFNISNRKQFEKAALKAFRHQHSNNPIYREFCDHLAVEPGNIKTIGQIPFLPIEFFKSHQIITGNREAEIVFTSSGTSGQSVSRHFVADVEIYTQSFRHAFAMQYGNIQNYTILALLPSYLERDGSSLVYMVSDMIKSSGKRDSNFYLDDLELLAGRLEALDKNENVLLIGVTYALLDLIARRRFALKNTIVMETGGMKGRRREMIRDELHAVLSTGFGVKEIHSEYGMTELLSQAYSIGRGRFTCPPWMDILIRDPEDALSYNSDGKSGGVNVIDLANINSCCFIATQDLGKKHDDGTFEILGRFDNSDVRGCNLMVF